MSVNILHISDLHFRAPAELNKNICQSNTDFCNEFISYIKGIGNIDYLIFTGDAINQGYVKAFKNAKTFLAENPEIFDEVEQAVRDKMLSKDSGSEEEKDEEAPAKGAKSESDK